MSFCQCIRELGAVVMAKSLSEQIAEIANKPVNEDFDIEDGERRVFEHNSENGSDISDDDEVEDESLKNAHYVEVGASKLRKSNERAELQEPKYQGTVGSRKDLFDGGSNDIPEDDMISEDEENASDAVSFRTDSEDELISEEKVEGDDDDTNAKRENLARIIQQETKSALNKLSQTAQRDAAKGYSILEQSKLFDNIIDVRIKLQKVLNAANGLPLSQDSWDEYLNKENEKLLKKNSALLETVFNQLLTFRTKFQIGDHINQEPENTETNKQKRSFDEIQEDTDKLDNELKEYRSAVLNKWSSKISTASGNVILASNKFKAINQSADVQVENQLADMSRLIKRTRLNRRNIVPLNFMKDYKDGKLEHIIDTTMPEENEDNENGDIPKNYDPRRKDNNAIDTSENPYIFDDEDFYRLLLNDLIDKKISDNNNLQNKNNIITITSRSNNKLKKNIDTKASKGRKLNFTIQEPIANYEAPINSGYKWSNEQIDEYFSGLLGQRINFDENEREGESEDFSDEEKQTEADAIKKDNIQIFG